jgi:hypothetical protein
MYLAKYYGVENRVWSIWVDISLGVGGLTLLILGVMKFNKWYSKKKGWS